MPSHSRHQRWRYGPSQLINDRVRPFPTIPRPFTCEQSICLSRFRSIWRSTLELIFTEVEQWEQTTPSQRVLTREVSQAMRSHLGRRDDYVEHLMSMVTIQMQIACGGKSWNFDTFNHLPRAIPSQSGLYLILLETPVSTSDSDRHFNESGLDLYVGQASAETFDSSVWKGLPRRLLTYERKARQAPSDLYRMRLSGDGRSDVLHIYCLCASSRQIHSRVIALAPAEQRNEQSVINLRLDLTVMETAMIIILGTMMSVQGQKAFAEPIRWMPHCPTWAHKARQSIRSLPTTSWYGANRALPFSQHVCRSTLPPYYEILCSICKSMFNTAGMVTFDNGKVSGDDDFKWFRTKQFPSIWHFLSLWLQLVSPENSAQVNRRDIQLFWRYYAQRQIRHTWQLIPVIKPPPSLRSDFDACVALSLRGSTVRAVRDHWYTYLTQRGILQDYRGSSFRSGVTVLDGFDSGDWIEAFDTFRDPGNPLPLRICTIKKFVSFFYEMKDKWLREWTRELSGSNYQEARGMDDVNADDSISAKNTIPYSRWCHTWARDFVREVMEEEMGVVANMPCSNCARRKDTCWLYIKDQLGRCINCTRRVLGHMTTTQCARSRGLTDEDMARPNRRLGPCGIKGQAWKQGHDLWISREDIFIEAVTKCSY